MEIRELGIMVRCSIWIIDSAASNALRKTDRAGVYKFFKFQPRGIFQFFLENGTPKNSDAIKLIKVGNRPPGGCVFGERSKTKTVGRNTHR
jgi:hypothetical protein